MKRLCEYALDPASCALTLRAMAPMAFYVQVKKIAMREVEMLRVSLVKRLLLFIELRKQWNTALGALLRHTVLR